MSMPAILMMMYRVSIVGNQTGEVTTMNGRTMRNIGLMRARNQANLKSLYKGGIFILYRHKLP
jgi:hypothetical protein